jgi:hypothetical protein
LRQELTDLLKSNGIETMESWMNSSSSMGDNIPPGYKTALDVFVGLRGLQI